MRAAIARVASGATAADRMAAMKEIEELAPQLTEATKDNLSVGLKMILDDLAASLAEPPRANHKKERP